MGWSTFRENNESNLEVYKVRLERMEDARVSILTNKVLSGM